jgi:hypothetical protein
LTGETLAVPSKKFHLQENPMKKVFALMIMTLCAAFTISFITSCDDSSDGSTSCEPGTWKVVTPKNGTKFEDCKGSFVLKYCGTLDTTIDTEQIYLPTGTDTFNDANSTITIDGGTVTVDIDETSSLDSETLYEEIEISGFTDAETGPIVSYTTTGYSFTSCDK